MTPKEKAKQLANRMYNNHENMYDARQCAIVAVEELIDEVLDLDRLKYWNEVKKEIENN